MINWFKKEPKFQWTDWELHETKTLNTSSGGVARKWEIYKRTREDGLVEYKQITVFDWLR